jgi:hypothetical protein
MGDSTEQRRWARELRSFFVVGHCLWAWLFGSLGALLAGHLARQAVAPIAEASSPPPQESSDPV